MTHKFATFLFILLFFLPTSSHAKGVDWRESFERQVQGLERLAATGEPVFFYDNTDPLTYFLGNFYPCRIKKTQDDGSVTHYACSEAYYQAQKFIHHPELMSEFSQLRGSKAGEYAWRLAQENKHLCRKDWFGQGGKPGAMDISMQEALCLKFLQNPDLQKLILATGGAELVEHTYRDRYWGDGGDGSGENMLGKYLMEIRQGLKNW